MAETLTIRTASSTEVVKIAVPGPQGPKGDKGDPGDVAGLPLSAQGDTLYRGASQNERLPIGTTGQVLKVAGGIPTWANESGAVSSVAGRTGAVTLASADISSEQVLEVSEAGDANCNGVFVYGGDYNGRPTYYKDKDTFVYWDNVWNISHNADDKYFGTNTSRPWQAVWSLGSATGNLPVVEQLNSQEYEKAVGQRTNPTAFGTASGKNVGTGANDVAAGNDARFTDARQPLSHSSTHHTGGADAIAPNQISAAWALETRSHSFFSTSTYTLLQGRNVELGVSLSASNVNGTVTLPRLTTDGAQNDDELFINLPFPPNGGTLTIRRYIWTGSSYLGSTETVVTATTVGAWRFRLVSGVWTLQPVANHTHAASDITSGSLDIARIPTGTSSSTVCIGNDSRLSDSRAPTAHAAAHASAGSDPLFDQDLDTTDSPTFAGATFGTIGDGWEIAKSGLQHSSGFVIDAEAGAILGTTGNPIGLASGLDFVGANPATDAATTRTNLGLGDAATADIGTAAGEVAEGNHTHELTALAATGATNGHVLTANGSNGVTFAALPASGVTGAAASASDVLGVSGANITGVDATADRIVFWDDSASALKYLEVSTGLSLSGTTLTATATGTIGGSTGSTDNLILRSDGTGGATLQNSALRLDDATTSTQANVAIVNAHSETNSSLVLTPKGTGAFIVGPPPDGTATGGNARGARAIDISLTRGSEIYVASGSDAVAVGNNTICSTPNSVAVGHQASVFGSGSQSTAIGYNSFSTGTGSFAGGANTNASSTRAVALCGGTANNTNSVAIGQVTASADNAFALGVGSSLLAEFATRPFRSVFWSGQTTNNSATVLNLGGTATNRFTIAASTALAVDILLVARRATTQDKWLVARRFLGIRRDGSNNTSLIGTVQEVAPDQSAGSPTWTYSFTADDTNEALQCEVTGATGETVEWRVTAFYRVA